MGKDNKFERQVRCKGLYYLSPNIRAPERGARCRIPIMNGTRESATLRSGMSVDENLFSHSQKSIRRTGFLAFRRRSSCSATLELLCGNENYIRSEVANLPKILSGPKGNKASKTAASVEMLNGRENPHGVRLPKKLWKCSKRWLKEDNSLGGILFYKCKLLGILYLDVP